MTGQPLTISSFPRAIVHIDGDAFFASCEQARHPELKGKPVVTGKERGIAASMSYEAKARGVTRAMRLSEVRKTCPEAIILPSDYEAYSLFSKRLFTIVRRYTPDVEEYSIDECFADLTGLQRPLRMNYRKIAARIKTDLEKELGCTFTIGLAPNKTVAKIASKWKKPSGLTIIPGKRIHLYLKELPVEKIWGIGPQTAAYLQKWGVITALQLARRSEEWLKRSFNKPVFEIWQELHGKFILKLATQEKEDYTSIQKVKTFTPSSNNREFIFAQLSKNIENACIKARRYQLAAKETAFFLRTQDFQDTGIRIKFSRPTAFPNEIVHGLKAVFSEIYQPTLSYRSTGVTLLKLTGVTTTQIGLFENLLTIEKFVKLYKSVDAIRDRYGKHTLYLGSSHWAQQTPPHKSERTNLPQRKRINVPTLISDIRRSPRGV